MADKNHTLKEVVSITKVNKETILSYENEGLITPLKEEGENVYSEDDIEKIRMINRLISDLGVNLPGVEVILNMREQMINMQDEFETMIEEMRRSLIKELKGFEFRSGRPMIEGISSKAKKVRIE